MQKTLIAFLLAIQASVSSAGIQDKLDEVFGDLTNATSPMLYQGQRRGAIVGGSFYARSRIMRPNLINFTPPGFRAGCGGIDLFGGSFSFISMDQFVQLLRSIGQNAVGYAFQIALNAICGDCLEVLSSLQKQINSLNQYFGNSCQIAKTIVDETIGSSIHALGTQVHDAVAATGIGDLVKSITGTDPVKELDQAAKSGNPKAKAVEQKYVLGNLIWRSLVSSGADTWFGEPDITLLEAILSMTGSIVVQEATKVSDDEGYNYKIVHLGRILKVHDLLRGGKVDIWKCDTTGEDGCLNPGKQEVQLEGLDQRVLNLMNDLLNVFENDTSFSSSIQGFLENSLGIGGMVRNLYRSHPQVGRMFATKSAPILSAEMVYTVAADMIRSARISLRKIDHPSAGEALKLLDEAFAEMMAEYQKIVAERGSSKDLFEFYHNLSLAMHPEQFDHSVGLPAHAESQTKMP